MADLITVASFESPTNAELARTVLEAEGVKAFVIGDQSISINPIFTFYPGMRVRLQVMAQDAKRAQEVLSQNEMQQSLERGFEACPNCGGADIKRLGASRRSFIAWGYIFVPIAIVLGLWRRSRRCNGCGHSWRT